MIDIHQRQDGTWCYVDHQSNVGHKYSPMSEWVGQFETRQEAVLAARAKAAEARLLAAYEEVTRQATRAERAEAEIEQLRNEKESLREQLDEALAQIESMWKTIAP
jgi:chromosome segregation ATPase